MRHPGPNRACHRSMQLREGPVHPFTVGSPLSLPGQNASQPYCSLAQQP